MSDDKNTGADNVSKSVRPSWPIKDRARDMLKNTEYRGQGWSEQRTSEVNNKGKS